MSNEKSPQKIFAGIIIGAAVVAGIAFIWLAVIGKLSAVSLTAPLLLVALAGLLLAMSKKKGNL